MVGNCREENELTKKWYDVAVALFLVQGFVDDVCMHVDGWLISLLQK